jgi:Cu+-exporting ATPase
MENIQWKVDGMSCTNCALSIHKYLSSKGIHEPKVNFMEGEVQFELADASQKPALLKGIQGLGYKVRGQANEEITKKWLDNNKERAIFSLIFTVPLILHMIPGVHIHFLMNPYVQLGLTLPVFIVGMNSFGKSAINS